MTHWLIEKIQGFQDRAFLAQNDTIFSYLELSHAIENQKKVDKD